MEQDDQPKPESSQQQSPLLDLAAATEAPAKAGDGQPSGGKSGDGQSPEQPDRAAQPVDAEQPPRLPFLVVGIGGSARGLEAFTEFFRAMRPDSGMAFVVVQHLPPERESMLVEILSKR